MTPPPIRYPLPTLILLVILGIALPTLESWSRPLRHSIQATWTRLVEGPPVPASDSPQVLAGPVVRRGLLLQDGVPATDRPGGTVVETIQRRMFVDVFDVWPLTGRPTHYRVGNRAAIGWVSESQILPWSTRLVVKIPTGRVPVSKSNQGGTESTVEVGSFALPVLSQTPERVQVAVWDRSNPWSAISQEGWIRSADLSPSSWGVLLSREEVAILFRESLKSPEPGVNTTNLRLRAVLGRLLNTDNYTPEQLDAARSVLPDFVFEKNERRDHPGRTEEIATLGNPSTLEASWNGLQFVFVPIQAIR